MIAKVDTDLLPVILDALLTINPNYDRDGNLFLYHWDFGLEAVILYSLSKSDCLQLRQIVTEKVIQLDLASAHLLHIVTKMDGSSN